MSADKSKRQKKLFELIDRFGREAVRQELNISEKTLDSYLKVPNTFVRMAPFYALRLAEMRLEKGND